MNAKLLFLLLIFFEISPGFAQFYYFDTPIAMPFLGTNIGDPVAAALGETGVTSYSGGSQGILLNPAHVNRAKTWEAFSLYRGFASLKRNRNSIFKERNMKYYAIGVSGRVEKNKNIGFFLQRFNDHSSYKNDTGESYFSNINETIVGFSFGTRLKKNLLWGINAKYLVDSRFGARNSGVALDLGLNWILPASAVFDKRPDFNQLAPEQKSIFSIGLALKNTGLEMDFGKFPIKRPLPQTLYFGMAYQQILAKLHFRGLFEFEKRLIRFDEEKREYDPFYKALFTAWKGKTLKEAVYHFGLETNIFNRISLRYGLRYEPVRPVDQTIITYGIGIDLKYLSINFGKWKNPDYDSFYNIIDTYTDSYSVSVNVKNIHF